MEDKTEQIIETVQKNAQIDDERKWCVYCHTNKTNGKKYFGVTSKSPEERWKNGNGYKKTQTYFYRAINKYTWDGFEHEIIANGLTESEAKNKEVELIALYKTNCNRYYSPTYGYNMTDGGDGVPGRTHTPESRKKIGQSSLVMWQNPEIREKLILKRSGENNCNYGKVFSAETRQKISESRKGKCIGEENGFYGKHHSNETKEYLRQIKTKVPVISEIGIFESVRAASRCINGSSAHISECCRGKRKTEGININTGERLHWLYVYDQKQDDGSVIQGAITLGYVTEEQVNEYLNNLRQKGND